MEIRMSRFSREKREKIDALLRSEAEALFLASGLRDVTVDEIAHRVGIGKGTFYHFYENKEHLYLELFVRAQEEVFRDADICIRETGECGSRELCFRVMMQILRGFAQHPILIRTDMSTWLQATQKVGKDYQGLHVEQDLAVFEKVKATGARFAYSDETVIRLMQTGCRMAMMLLASDREMTVGGIMMRALLDHIVVED
jgi:AcrR family transcriptional regulator